MAANFINYFLLGIGIITVLVTLILIFVDKLKGDDMYFNIDVKEQEMKKVMEDAEEILSELNFTSDVIVKEIEEKITHLNKTYRNVNQSMEQIHARPAVIPQEPVAAAPSLPTEKNAVPARFKPITVMTGGKTITNKEKPKTKQQMIAEMAAQGISVVDIAKNLNMGQGEVALILSLKNEES
jgi:DNA-binding NarL/FixJ family response regulator